MIVSIDDDAEFASRDTVAQVLSLFENPKVGAIALPHVDLLKGSEVQQQPPDDDGTYVTNCFRGTAYAVRRDLFLELGGFRESLYHQAEEQDLCLRMLAAGGSRRWHRPNQSSTTPRRTEIRSEPGSTVLATTSCSLGTTSPCWTWSVGRCELAPCSFRLAGAFGSRSCSHAPWRPAMCTHCADAVAGARCLARHTGSTDASSSTALSG